MRSVGALQGMLDTEYELIMPLVVGRENVFVISWRKIFRRLLELVFRTQFWERVWGVERY